jgi:hypothetical protein
VLDCMRSYDEQRQQKTPQGASLQEVAVKPEGIEMRGLSSSSAENHVLQRTVGSNPTLSVIEKVRHCFGLLVSTLDCDERQGVFFHVRDR